jgi:hypothetical protein
MIFQINSTTSPYLAIQGLGEKAIERKSQIFGFSIFPSIHNFKSPGLLDINMIFDGDALENGASPKRRDNSPTPGRDILEDVVDSSTRRSLLIYHLC